MPKFSVIVPVYNVERYLKQCIESILNQSFQNYEILLINDGSTDRSGLICDEYALKYSQIRVIHKVNSGLSDTRNLGVKKATSQYIIFIDSDDYIELDTFEKFNNKLEKYDNPDVLISQIKKVYGESEIRYLDYKLIGELINKSEKGDIIEWIFKKSDNTWPSVRYIVKRDLIDKYNLKFSSGYLHEDIDWTAQLFFYAETFTYSDFYWYNHRMEREGSITTSKTIQNILDTIKLVEININDDRYKDMETTLKEIIFERLVKSVFYSLNSYKFYDEDEKKIVAKVLYNKQEIFKYTKLLHHKVFIYFSKIFGFEKGLDILNLIHKM